MRSLATLVAFVLAWPAVAVAADNWSDVAPGIRLLRRTTDRPWRIFALQIDLCARGVTVRATAEGERWRTVPSFADRVGAVAAVNADFFSYDTQRPTGLAAHAGDIWAPHLRGGGEALFGDDRAWLQTPASAANVPPWVREAVGARPMLVVEGEVPNSFNRGDCSVRHPRTAIGLSADRRTLTLAVVDGRSNRSIGMTCAELGGLMAGLGAHRAMNLDGGGSSTLWARGTGVVNSPSDGRPRTVANHLGILVGNGPPGSCAYDEAEVIDQAALLDGGSTDVDGDGRADLCGRGFSSLMCHASTGNGAADDAWIIDGLGDEQGWGDPTNFSTLRFGDLNGDGRADVCLRANAGVRCWTSNGAGFDRYANGPAWSDADGWKAPGLHTTIRLADVTGDGRADLCARDTEGVVCHPSTGEGFGPAFRGPGLSDATGWAGVDHFGTLRFGDIDGDGRADVCARAGAGMRCWRSTGDGFNRRVDGPAWSDAAGFDDVARWSTIRLTDVDGDGRADLCARTGDAFACHPSTGDGFGPAWPAPALGDGSGWRDHDNYGTIRLADVDGDGDRDLCARANARVFCWLFEPGAGFDARIDGPELSDDSGWGDGLYNTSLRWGDLNGDGKADLCARAAAGVRCWRSTGDGFRGSVVGPEWSDAADWDRLQHRSTFRFAGGGPLPPPPPDDPDAGAPAPVDAGAPPPDAGARRDAQPPGNDADGAVPPPLRDAGRAPAPDGTTRPPEPGRPDASARRLDGSARIDAEPGPDDPETVGARADGGCDTWPGAPGPTPMVVLLTLLALRPRRR